MAYLQSLPAPHSLDVNDSNIAEKWNEWKEMWLHYSVAAEVNKEDGEVQVATFLTATGPEARKVFKTWKITADAKKDIKPWSSDITVARERMFLLSNIVLIYDSKSLANPLIGT